MDWADAQHDVLPLFSLSILNRAGVLLAGALAYWMKMSIESVDQSVPFPSFSTNRHQNAHMVRASSQISKRSQSRGCCRPPTSLHRTRQHDPISV